MSLPMVLLPVFVQVFLTFAVLLWMARARVNAVKTKQVRMADIALGQRAWPAKAQQISNSYHSQLQVPVLFYVLVVLAIITRSADLLFVVLSWVFVLSRLGARLYPHQQQLRPQSLQCLRRRRHHAAGDVGDLRRAHPRRPAMSF